MRNLSPVGQRGLPAFLARLQEIAAVSLSCNAVNPVPQWYSFYLVNIPPDIGGTRT